MSTIKTICVTAIFFAITACSGNDNPFSAWRKSIDQHSASAAIGEGQRLYMRGEYALAIPVFKREIRANPDGAEGYNGLAACYDMLGRFDVAGQYYEYALARAPMNGKIYRNMARSLAMQGRKGEAEALLAEWDAINAGHMVAATMPTEANAAQTSITDSITDTMMVATSTSTPIVAATTAIGVEGHLPRATEAASVMAIKAPGPVVEQGRSLVAKTNGDGARSNGTASYIRLMNAAGERGLAKRVQLHLAKSGINHTQVGDSDKKFGRSWVVYPLGQRDLAISIQKKLPFPANVVPEPRASRVVVLLGANAVATKKPLANGARRG